MAANKDNGGVIDVEATVTPAPGEAGDKCQVVKPDMRRRETRERLREATIQAFVNIVLPIFK